MKEEDLFIVEAATAALVKLAHLRECIYVTIGVEESGGGAGDREEAGAAALFKHV